MMRKQMTTKQRGMTLIELMIAVSILSILLAIIIPNVFIMVKRAQNADITNNGKKFHQFLEAYAVESQSATSSSRQYPANATEILGNPVMKSLFLEHNISNPFYPSPNSAITNSSNLTASYVGYTGSGAGNVMVLIPESAAEFNTLTASGATLSGSTSGAIIYFPFDVNSNYADVGTDPNVMIDGFQIRAVDSEGRVIPWYSVGGGNPYSG